MIVIFCTEVIASDSPPSRRSRCAPPSSPYISPTSATISEVTNTSVSVKYKKSKRDKFRWTPTTIQMSQQSIQNIQNTESPTSIEVSGHANTPAKSRRKKRNTPLSIKYSPRSARNEKQVIEIVNTTQENQVAIDINNTAQQTLNNTAATSTTSPVPPLRMIQVESPKGTARTVQKIKGRESLIRQNLQQQKEIEELKKKVTNLKNSKFKLLQLMSEQSCCKPKPVLDVEEEQELATNTNILFQTTKQRNSKNCTNNCTKKIVGVLVGMALFIGGYFTHFLTFKNGCIDPLPELPTLDDFKHLNTELSNTQDALNTSMQIQTELRDNYTRSQHESKMHEENWQEALQERDLCNNDEAACQAALKTTQDTLNNALAQKAQLEKQIDELNSTLLTCQEYDQSLQTNLTIARGELSVCQATIEACQDTLDILNQNAQELQTNLSTALQEKADCETALTTAQNSLSVCQTDKDACQVALVATNQTAQTLQTNLSTAMQEKADCETALTTAQNSLSVCEANKDLCQVALVATNNTLNQANGVLSDCQTDKQVLQTNLTNTKKYLNKTQSDLKQSQSDLAQTQSQLTNEQTCSTQSWNLLTPVLRRLLPTYCP